MKGHRLYRQIRESLKNFYPVEPTGNLARHLNTLAGFICGIIQSNRVNLPAVASELPNVGKEQSRVAQLKRWLTNKMSTSKATFCRLLNLYCDVLPITNWCWLLMAAR